MLNTREKMETAFNAIDDYMAYFTRRATALHKKNTITDEVYQEYKTVLNELKKVTHDNEALLALMNTTIPADYETSRDLPEHIMSILKKYCPYANKLEWGTNEIVAMISLTFENTRAYSIILNQKFHENLDAIANYDSDFAEKLLCYKGTVSSICNEIRAIG